MLQEEDKAPYESVLDLKGDDFQKLSVIHNLPSLLATDTQSCMSRVVPKMQQSLPTASTEFHLAASSTFKTILEQKLVNHNVFSQTFLQSILNSLDSRDPVVCDAWLETLLDAIELLPVEVIRSQILPLTIIKGQLSQPIYSRVTCSRLLGKICTRFDSSMIQKEVLPTVHSLCQDVNSEVRASICLQLRFVAEGLGAESVKPALLPSLVELASDEESNVRCTSVQTIVYLLPHLQEDTIKTTIVPLVKKLCENAMKLDDNVICIIAQEFGKLVLGLEKCLIPTEKTWFLKYFQQLAQMGIVSMKKESKPHLLFITSNPAEDEKYMECRRCCAYNLPAMFLFVSSSADDTDALLITFNALAGDHYYMVRKTVAGGIHEVAKVLGPKNGRIKSDLIKLLKDDSEEVLQGLVPHIGLTLDCLAESQTIGVDRMDSTLTEIGRALLKCEAEISSTHNWRLTALMHSQLEIIAKYFPSDFIYSYFVPMAFFRILHARPIPVRLAAGTLYLFLLRYNMKAVQRIELRCKLYTELANSPDCYVRMMFVRMMVEAMDIFSSAYFKEHFFSVLLNLAEDPVANIRIKVVSLLPQLKSQLWMPTDKKLLTALETTIGHLMNSEKDRDVIAVLASVVRKLNEIKLKYDGQTPANKHTKQDIEDARKLEEEKRLSGLATGKSPPGGAGMKKGTWRRTSDNGGKTMPQTTPKEGSGSPRHSSEGSRASSMPEIPVMLSDDEFLVDAGIRIPAQFSQSMSKIPHLQDSVFTKRRTLFNFERSRSVGMNFDKGKSKGNLSVEYEDCIKRRINGVDQSNNGRTSMDCEDGLRMVKESLGKKVYYVGPLMRSRFGFGVNQERSMDEKMKRNSLILDKDKPKVLQTKCPLERTKRHSASFDKGKPKGKLSVEYEDCIKRRANGPNQSNNGRTSIDYEDGLRLGKEDQQQLDSKDTVYLGSMVRTRFGSINQERSIDEKMKRNSLVLDKDKPKLMHTKCTLDRTKRHSANFSLKPGDSKEMKPNMKCHSLEMVDYAPSERLGRALRRYSTLDVNHNQGLSKIPVRSFVPRSRTAPATRASSPVHIEKLCRMPFWES
ncbi:serine/threonine-protein phosphatase 4 regulatory subunit 4-like isoform X3 [Hylaeus volcanicus]|uniref:serine/threonine-protein phosphatase 4 regulatory subunit 4-like isoform X3 n=1 Tax=Hylaeus volcanicus TaxID=313075 RepID=UPI0023B7A821|nr:serine/threonine-protein phosphatase 4 regulatory subunit 4-like isoform X3 [Hylaeus volcanicus]